MSDNDRRPRPQFGEYATPEQQRAAIKAPEANPHYAPPPRDEPVIAGGDGAAQDARPTRPTPPASSEPRPVAPGEAPSPAGQAFLRHPVDRVTSIALLVFGLYNVIIQVATRNDLGDQLDAAYHALGLSGDYAVIPLTQTVANVVAVVFVVLWIGAAVATSLMIRRGRVAFWIPLTAGVLASLVNGAGYFVLFMHDPVFQHAIQTGL